MAEIAIVSEQFNHVQLFDPVPASMTRIKGMDRAQLLVQARSRRHLQVFLSDWYRRITALPIRSKIRWHLEVDPLTL